MTLQPTGNGGQPVGRAHAPVQLEPRPSWPCPCPAVRSPQKASIPPTAAGPSTQVTEMRAVAGAPAI